MLQSKETILITGGLGFIGSHLVELVVAEGYNVIVLDDESEGKESNINCVKSKVHLIRDDINNINRYTNWISNCSFVVHLAAKASIVPSIEDPAEYFETNVSGTFKVLEAVRLHCPGLKKFVYATSSSSYGIPDVYPTPETAKISPQYPYALTKYLGEELVMHWGKVYRMPCISLRFFNVYGPRVRTNGTYGAVMGVFMAQRINNKPLTIVGNGEQKRDFTYVSDVCEAILAACKSETHLEIFNVGSGASVTVNEIARLIGGHTVSVPKRPGEPDQTFADISKITSTIDWEPRISIKKGIGTMLEQSEGWRGAPVWTPDDIEAATKSWFRLLGDDDNG